jgi:hypothetical protein
MVGKVGRVRLAATRLFLMVADACQELPSKASSAYRSDN